MKFVGRITDEDWAVFVDGKELNLYLEHINHSPTGFAWGYYGSGPAQLAFAMLLESTGDLNFAKEYYQDFKNDIIAKLDQRQGWEFTNQDIYNWYAKKFNTNN